MQNIRTFKRMFVQLTKILSVKQKKQGITLFFLLIIVSMLEMLGVSVVIPFILAMMDTTAIMQNQYVEILVNILNIQDSKTLLSLIAVMIVFVYILKNGTILLVNRYQVNYRNELEKDLSIQMLSSYMKRPYTYFLDNNSAKIIRGITGDIASVAAVLDNFSGFLAEMLTCAFIISFIVFLDFSVAIYLIGISGFTALIIILVFKRKLSLCGREARVAFTERQQYAYQVINGIKEITVMQRRDSFVKQYADASEKARKCNNMYLFIGKIPNRLVETVFLGSLALLVCISMNNSNSQAEFISVLGALAVAAVRILPSISSIAGYINGLIYSRSGLEEAYENIMQAKIQEDKSKNYTANNIEKIDFKDCIEIKNISWRYKENLPFVLRNLSFSIKKGEAIALIGESGAGKTTLADVILGLLRPEKGEILVDGNNIYDIPYKWAKMIGYVPQIVFLTDDTIRNNIAFGISKEEQVEEKIWYALEQAQLNNVVNNLENGLDTIVGERGIKFSGGQRQRIAIARALYYNPDILVLDEATSALDTETETAVMESIDALHGKKTLVIIAHRLSTISKCDKIYEVKEGKILLRDKGEVLKK